tara:strand:+ start:58079 stop:58639 length:561 start_codon:yes stop_codon:yes gene_type:complete
MSEPVPSDLLVVGKITGAYGIKGWVKIHSYTEPQENFLSFGRWFIKRRDGLQAIEFDTGRRQGKGLVAHIVGLDDRNEVDAYRGLEVSAIASELPELAAGDYYWRDLQGLQVWCRDIGSETADDSRVLLGVVDHLIETGANDVLVVQPSPDSIDERERLVPYLPEVVVTQVDLPQGKIEVDWYPDE